MIRLIMLGFFCLGFTFWFCLTLGLARLVILPRLVILLVPVLLLFCLPLGSEPTSFRLFSPVLVPWLAGAELGGFSFPVAGAAFGATPFCSGSSSESCCTLSKTMVQASTDYANIT